MRKFCSILCALVMLLTFTTNEQALANSAVVLGETKAVDVQGTIRNVEYRGTTKIKVLGVEQVDFNDYKQNITFVDWEYGQDSVNLDKYDAYLVTVECTFRNMKVTNLKSARKRNVIDTLQFSGTTKNDEGKVTSNLLIQNFDSSIYNVFYSKYGESKMKKGKKYKLSATGDVLVIVPKGSSTNYMQLIVQEGSKLTDNGVYWFNLQE